MNSFFCNTWHRKNEINYAKLFYADIRKCRFIVDREFLASLLCEDPPYCLPPLFKVFTSPPFSASHTDTDTDTHIHTHTHTPDPPARPAVLFAVFFLWLNGWLRYIWCVVLPNDIIYLHMSNLGILVPQEHCGVFYATKPQCTVYSVQFFASTLIWYHKHTHRYTANTGVNRLTPMKVYIHIHIY